MPWRYISQRRQLLRAYYTGIGKTAIIYPAAFIVIMGGTFLNFGLLFFMKDRFHCSEGVIAWVAATWALAYVASCLAVRPWFSRVLPRYLMMGANFASFVLALAMWYAPSLAWMFVVNGLRGIVMALFWPPLMGWLSTDVEGAELSKVVSRFNLSWSLGAIVSPYLAGWLTAKDPGLPLLVGSGLFLMTGVFIAGAAMALPGVRREAANNGTDPTGPNGREPAGRDTPLRYPGWVGLFTSHFAVGVVGVLFPLAAREALLWPAERIGAVLLVRALCSTVAFILLGRLLFWHFRCGPMLAMQLVGAATFLGMAYARSTGLIVGLLALTGFNTSMAYAFSVFHGASGSANRERRMAIHEAVLSAGMVLGPGIGGMVYDAFSSAAVYHVTGAVLIAGTIVQGVLCVILRRRP